jgi:site-specific DNA-methyltransferase (adenine-specific)
MGAAWDRTGIAYSIDLWKECLRVLKPGGHILSFGATKTYHRMACAIEDAGFETRNCINWIYMQGFSKGVNISKAFDKKAKAEREVIGIKKGGGMSVEKGNIFRDDNWTPKSSDLPITIPATDLAKQWDDWHSDLKPSHELIYVGRKPLSEKTIVDNVEKWGTGALNIGESRVEADPKLDDMHRKVNRQSRKAGVWGKTMKNEKNLLSGIPTNGRFPSNTIIDGSPEVLTELRSYGQRTSGSMKPHHKVGNKKGDGTLSNKILGTYNAKPYKVETEQSTGTIDRFFKKCEFADIDVPAFLYYPKPSQAERNLGCEGLTKEVGHNRFDKCATCGGTILQNPDRPSACKCETPVIGNNIIKGNYHHTVKPVALMRYLIKLITPKHGTVLDPFCGSGTTLVAAEELKEFYWIGIDNDPDAVLISNSRLKPFLNLNSLFDERQK